MLCDVWFVMNNVMDMYCVIYHVMAGKFQGLGQFESVRVGGKVGFWEKCGYRGYFWVA